MSLIVSAPTQTLTTAYAAEICPVKLRGLLASYVNMAWGIGIVLAVSLSVFTVPRASIEDVCSIWPFALFSSSYRQALREDR